MAKSSSSTSTFFSIFAFTLALFLASGLIVGSLSFAGTWWVLLLALGAGIAFTGAAMREAREAQPTAIVAQSPLVEASAPIAKKPAKPVPVKPEPTAPVPVEEPEEAPAAKPAKAEASSPAEPDKLTRLEGIGPKTSKALISQGVDTFAKLADMSLDEIRDALEAGGVRFAPAAESWAEQASYAAKGDWDGLEALQDTLIAGRYPTDD